MLYLCNESNESEKPGDLRIYSTLQKMLGHIEAIDVRNSEYFCFDSEGHCIYLSADDDYGQINFETEKSPSHVEEVRELLSLYLMLIAENGRFGVDKLTVQKAFNLSELVELIPDELIE